MISENPFLGPEWEPLGELLAKIMTRYQHDAWSISTYMRRYQFSPSDSPYIQASPGIDDELITVEISANLQVNPKLTDEEYDMIEFFGWAKPHEGEFAALCDDEYDPNPNFHRIFASDVPRIQIAEGILEVMAGVYKMTNEDLFAVQSKGKADWVDSLGIFGRLPSHEGNPDGVIFSQPGNKTFG